MKNPDRKDATATTHAHTATRYIRHRTLTCKAQDMNLQVGDMVQFNVIEDEKGNPQVVQPAVHNLEASQPEKRLFPRVLPDDLSR